jgi:hypothetical protein
MVQAGGQEPIVVHASTNLQMVSLAAMEAMFCAIRIRINREL